MKLYELTYLISPDFSEEEINFFQEKINSFIQKEGGVLVEVNSPIKKNLAYPIKRRGEVYLAIVNFQLNPEGLTNLERKLKSEDQILRYLILTKELPKKVEIPAKIPKKIIKPKPKVELKEIEKKLEEILGE